MRCAQCGWPSDETKVLSTHHTSEGWVRYRRCVCGAVSIQLITLEGREGAYATDVREAAAAR
jgi:transcriptional regulator NrdR family protein